MKELEDLLSVEAVAKKCGLAESTVYNFANRGIFPAIKMGKSLRFSPSQLSDALAKMQLRAYGNAA